MKFRDITEHAGTSPSSNRRNEHLGFRTRSKETKLEFSVPSGTLSRSSIRQQGKLLRIGPIPRWRTSISRVSTVVYEIKREVKIPSNGFTSVLPMSYRSIFFRNGTATFVSGIFFLGLVFGVHREKNDPEIGSRRVNRPSRDRFAQFRREVYTCTYIYVYVYPHLPFLPPFLDVQMIPF